MCLFRYSLVYQLTGQRLLRECTRVDAGCKTSAAGLYSTYTHVPTISSTRFTGKKSWSALDQTVLARSIWLILRKTFALVFLSDLKCQQKAIVFTSYLVGKLERQRNLSFHKFHRLGWCMCCTTNVLSEKIFQFFCGKYLFVPICTTPIEWINLQSSKDVIAG